MKYKWLLKMVFLIITTIFLSCHGTDSVPMEGVSQPVAYVSHPDAGWAASSSERELMLLEASTGKTWQLTSDRAVDAQPTWSPSGSHLMFLSDRNPNGSGLARMWSTGTGIRRLFIYGLSQGIIRHVDLSWARSSGPARAQGPSFKMQDLGWLECAAWSPLDTTKVAIGATVRAAQWKDADKKEELAPRERRIVLLDLETQTGKLLTTYSETSCHRLLWSPNGKYLGMIGPEETDYVDVRTGETSELKRTYVRWGGPLWYVPLDWTPDGNRLLVRAYSHNVDSVAVYEYDVQTDEWSPSLAVLADTARVQSYMPGDNGAAHGDLLVLNSAEDTFYDDLSRYRLPEADHVWLTDDQMPKLGVSSYHGVHNDKQ